MIKIDITKEIDLKSEEWKRVWQYLRASQLKRGYCQSEEATISRLKKAYERKKLVKEKLYNMFPTIDWNVTDPECIVIYENANEWFFYGKEDTGRPALCFTEDGEEKTIDVRMNLDVKANNTIHWSSKHVPDFRYADYVAVTDANNTIIHLYKNIVKTANKNWFTLVKVGIIKC